MMEEGHQGQKAAKFPQILAAIGACFGAFGLGTGLAWTSPALVEIQGDKNRTCINGDGCYFDDGDLLTPNEGSWIGSFFTIGALISSFVTGYLMSAIGRKWTMIVMVAPFTLGWILLTMCGPLGWTGAWIYYIGRLLTGFGGGAFSLAAPIYISETAEASLRGALGSCMQLLLTVGVLLVNSLGGVIDWDVLTGILIVFPVLLAGIMFAMPESPYYLVQKGKTEAAKKSLQWLRGKGYDIDQEFEAMEETNRRQEEIGTISIKEFLTKGVYIKPGLIMLALMFFQQYSGINAVLFYLTDIFAKATPDVNANTSAALVALVQVLATGVAVMIVEKFGRKILLIVSDVLMCVSILALGVYFYLDDNKCDPVNPETGCDPSIDLETVDSLGWLPLVSLIIYVFAFSIGFGPLPWMMNGEFFSLEAKGLASSIATAFNWFCAFMVSKFQVNIEDGIGRAGAYWLYAGVCAVGTVFIIFLVPETKGKSPEDMKAYFSKKK